MSRECVCILYVCLEKDVFVLGNRKMNSLLKYIHVHMCKHTHAHTNTRLVSDR